MSNAAAAVKHVLAITIVPVEGIRPSPSNPRKTFKAIDELAANIKEHGIKVPLRVRPVAATEIKNLAGGPSVVVPAHYELVFGERRWRAAKKAGLKEVPAIIEEMDDAEALQLMLVELAQTSDVHPVEEAEAYRELHTRHGMSVEAIAAKVGKSKRVVYERMQLCALAAPVKEAALKGELPPSHAVLLARVPAEFQEEALKKILRNGDYRGPMNHDDARDLIIEEYTLGLAEAPWDLKDAQLVPAAGACGPCPKRTGNQPELFHDVKAKDTCTDPACFASKKKAYVKLTIAKAEEEGRPTTTAAVAKKLVKDGRLIDLDTYAPGQGGKTYRQALGKKVEVMLAPAPEGVRELVTKEDAEKVLGKQKAATDYAAVREQQRKDQEKYEDEARQRTAVVSGVMGEVVKKLETRQLGKAAWFVIAEAAFEYFFEYNPVPDDVVVRRLGHAPRKSDDSKDTEDLRKLLPGMNAEQLCALVVELVLAQSEEFDKFYRKEKGALRDLVSILGVDEKKIAERVKAELKAAGKPGHVPPEPEVREKAIAKKKPAAQPGAVKAKAAKKKPGKKK